MSAVVIGDYGLGALVGSSLSTGIVAFWKLDEASGTRNDSVGSNHLTDNNTVTQAAGKVGNAAQFVKANLEYLSITDNADLSTGDIDFTIACWAYMDSKPASDNAAIVTKQGPGASLTEYIVRWEQSSDRFIFYIGGASFIPVTATTFGAPSLSTWYFICAWHDAAANTINIQINNGTVDSAATGGQVIPDSATAFNIGYSQATGAEYWDGRIDAVGFWKRVLASAERTELYNGGAGKEYPF